MKAKAVAANEQVEDIMPWSDTYRNGFRAIDNDHRQLFHLVNTLHAAVKRNEGPEIIGETFKALNNYIDERFTREEGSMVQADYPELTRHKGDHKLLATQVLDLEKRYRRSPSTFDFEEFLTFMERWLVQHIMKNDMKYVPHLRGET